jgi:hypothetical protein
MKIVVSKKRGFFFGTCLTFVELGSCGYMSRWVYKGQFTVVAYDIKSWT